MNKFILTLLSIILILLYSCKKSDNLTAHHDVANGIYATFEDGTGFFIPEKSTPYGDTIKFVFATHYPLDSDNAIDITRMSLRAYNPVTVRSGGELAEGIDLTKNNTITVRYSDGTEHKHIVVGEIRKSREALITEFSLSDVNLNGFLIEKDKLVGLVAGGIDVTNQKASVKISSHAVISPEPSIIQDYSKPVNFIITAEDGKTISTYTVKPITPQKLTTGLRNGSGRLLWTKTLEELGISNTNNWSTSIALSGKYLIINTRNTVSRYFDRFNGNYAGDMSMGDIQSVNFKNFYSTSDESGNILISNLTTGAWQDLYIYKWKSAEDPEPEKFIQWTNDIEGSQVGRKMSIKGDLNKDALIFMGVSNSNNSILRWQVIGGQLQSETPDLLIWSGENKWGTYADIISAGTRISDNLYISGNQSDLVCTNLETGDIFGHVDLFASGFDYNHSIDLTTFNHSQYLSALSINTLSGYSFLYNVTEPSLLSTPPGDPNYNNACVYKSDIVLAPPENGNASGDVLMKVSDDGYKMIMYILVTNGAVAAFEFDCIDLKNL